MDKPSKRRRRVQRYEPADPTCVIGYLRVSTREQAVSGLGLAAQREAIRAECERRGWTLCATYTDQAVSGSTDPDDRPGLAAALDALDGGKEAGTLVVAKADRLTRSLGDLCDLLDRAKRGQWALVCLDVDVDTTTPMGRAMAQIAGVFAELERALISQRTRDTLAVARANGVKLGRPATVGADARARITELRDQGETWRAIADTMNTEKWASGQGGRWHPGTCRRIALATH